MQRKFSNQSTDIPVLMCYVMTADLAILKTDHVIDRIGSLANFVSPMSILFSTTLDSLCSTHLWFFLGGSQSSGAQNTSEVQIYMGHFFWRPVDCPPAFKRTSCCHSSNTFLCKRNSFEMP